MDLVEHRFCLGHGSPSFLGTKGPAGSIHCGGEGMDWRYSRERDYSLSFRSVRAGWCSRGAVGSPLLARGARAGCSVLGKTSGIDLIHPDVFACCCCLLLGFLCWFLCVDSLPVSLCGFSALSLLLPTHWLLSPAILQVLQAGVPTARGTAPWCFASQGAWADRQLYSATRKLKINLIFP